MTTPVASPPAAAVPTRRRFTVAEYYAMADIGILSENDRVELLDGDVIVMPPIGDWHAASVKLFNNTILPSLQGRAIVAVQDPVRLGDDSQPQPDIMLLQWRDDFYRNGHPAPGDVLLLIEVADSSVEFDRTVKLTAYARAEIPELWIVARAERRIEAYTEPAGNEYATVRYFGPGETVAPQAFPDITMAVDRIIGD
ncbi:MAG: Uma2 family endonuclease [Chloroflexota bacterium]|nr:Uma2 family endonuclease [Chloroflexota bacterium]MDE2961300.1 Uma2 family endonuclease [Chloroflexota bacterium]